MTVRTIMAEPEASAAQWTPGSLKRALRLSERKRELWGWALLAPLLAFLLVNFLAPVVLMLARGVTERELPAALPRTAAALRAWDGKGLPDDKTVQILGQEMVKSRNGGGLSAVANRLNYDQPGFRSLLFTTARRLTQHEGPTTLQTLVQIDERWNRRETWAAMKHATGPVTSFYLLASVDQRLDADGRIQGVGPDRAVFIDVFVRTFEISAVVTLLCLVLGYPVAYLMANVGERTANLLMILVLLPFWTSILVRTTAWVVLLQSHGVINDALISIGLLAEPLQLIYNRAGVYIAMVHVLLPFLILPLYGVMKGVKPNAMRAALSLGASPLTAFLKVYAPQTAPGVTAGCLIVFILALGYYVTPALVGGAADQMISYFIAFYTNQSLNWGMAAALSLVLLIIAALFGLIYGRVAGARGLPFR